MKRLLILTVALAMIAAACSSDSTGDEPDPTPVNSAADGGDADGTCLAGDPDCADNPGSGDEPIDLDADGAPVSARGLSVQEVLSTSIDGGFAIYAFYLEDAGGPRLCDVLAESFPPQCGGDSIAVDASATDGISAIAGDGAVTTEQGVTWTDQPLSLIGEVVDGTFVLDADQTP